MFFSDAVQTPTGRSVDSYELHLEVSFGCSAFGSVRVRSSVDKYFWLFFSKERSSIVLDLSTTRTLLLSSWYSTTLNIQRWPPLLCWIRQVNSLLLTLSHCSSTQSVLLFKNVSSKQSILNNERLNFFFKLDAPRKKNWSMIPHVRVERWSHLEATRATHDLLFFFRETEKSNRSRGATVETTELEGVLKFPTGLTGILRVFYQDSRDLRPISKTRHNFFSFSSIFLHFFAPFLVS